MKISYNWLQEYFEKPLPNPKDLADLLNLRALEVEEIEEKDGDSIFEIKVTPNRAPDCLSHIGIAKEVAIHTKIQTSFRQVEQTKQDFQTTWKVEASSDSCVRYMMCEVQNVKVEESPLELKLKLESIGQRSINTIVDITNLVMYEIGQPMHAFDSSKLDGKVIKIASPKDIHFVTLDNKEVELTSEDFTIQDEKDNLAIAGVKGGKKAEVDSNTKNIILEAANFFPVKVRKTSRRTNIQTDSSKRFENGLTPKLTEKAIQLASHYIKIYASDNSTKFSNIIDIYPDPILEKKTIQLDYKNISKKLGIDISKEDLENTLKVLEIEFTVSSDLLYMLHVPYERLDLNLEIDIIEEIGRVYGYEHIKPTVLNLEPNLNVSVYDKIATIKTILIKNGFDEVITYSFGKKGDISVVKPLAKDKSYLRKNLIVGLTDALELNFKNKDLFAVDTIKIFEVGHVFTEQGEKTVLGIGIKTSNKKNKIKNILDETIKDISSVIGCEIKVNLLDQQEIIEIELDEILLKDFNINNELHELGSVIYQPFSLYPFMSRDIAVWAKNTKTKSDIENIITNLGTDLLIRYDLFDEFSKDDRTSYAYRLVFQSSDRTLTDEEINPIMDKIYTTLQSDSDFEIR